MINIRKVLFLITLTFLLAIVGCSTKNGVEETKPKEAGQNQTNTELYSDIPEKISEGKTYLSIGSEEPVKNDTNNLIFTGNNKIWSVELYVNKDQEKEFSLKYERENFKDVKNLEFQLNAPNWGWGMASINLDDEGMFITKEINPDKTPTSASEIINVEVKWNGNIENLTIAYKK